MKSHRFDPPSGLAKQVKTKMPPSAAKTSAKAAKVTPLKKVAAPTSTHSKALGKTVPESAMKNRVPVTKAPKSGV